MGGFEGNTILKVSSRFSRDKNTVNPMNTWHWLTSPSGQGGIISRSQKGSGRQHLTFLDGHDPVALFVVGRFAKVYSIDHVNLQPESEFEAARTLWTLPHAESRSRVVAALPLASFHASLKGSLRKGLQSWAEKRMNLLLLFGFRSFFSMAWLFVACKRVYIPSGFLSPPPAGDLDRIPDRKIVSMVWQLCGING